MREFLRHLIHVLGTALAVGALAAWPAWLWGRRVGLGALALAAGVCVLGALLGRGALVLMRRLDETPEGVARAIQTGIGVRLLGTLALCLPVVLAKWVPTLQLVVWLLLHYLAQLVLEVFVLLRELSQNHAPNGSAATDAEPPGGGDLPPSATQPEGGAEPR